jgi:hypothetical protein
MLVFRICIVALLVCLTGYTLVVGIQHGWSFLPIFFGDIVAMTWRGQFNVDFMTYLALSGAWVAWRHQFTAGAIALGIVAFVGGMLFFAPYLLWASVQSGGDAKVLLLGKARVASQ